MTAKKPHSDTEIGNAIREARRGVSIRELGRRAGVSPGQISRIEAGEVTRPSRDTLVALARGLGLNADLFLVIAGHLTGRGAHALLQQEAVRHSQMAEAVDSLSDNLWDVFHAAGISFGGEFPDEMSDEEQRSVAQSLLSFSSAYGSVSVADHGGEAAGQLREVARAWPALNDERRKLILVLLADQEVLSSLDRLPNPPGRYDLELQLSPREAQHEL